MKAKLFDIFTGKKTVEKYKELAEVVMNLNTQIAKDKKNRLEVVPPMNFTIDLWKNHDGTVTDIISYY